MTTRIAEGQEELAEGNDDDGMRASLNPRLCKTPARLPMSHWLGRGVVWKLRLDLQEGVALRAGAVHPGPHELDTEEARTRTQVSSKARSRAVLRSRTISCLGLNLWIVF